jgi:serine/threonine-protein kinase HipA
MQKGIVYNNGILAGYLEKRAPDDYHFIYDDNYLTDASCPPISLTLSKSQKQYSSHILFPFFAGLLPEGINRSIQCRLLKIDEKDDFTHLLRTTGEDTIGAITIQEITN